MDNISQLIKVLQASIAPVTMISGVGLLVLSMTNRYGRVIDRIRILVKEAGHTQNEVDRSLFVEQIKIFYARARLLRAVIVFATASIFFVSLTIFGLFAAQYFDLSVDLLIALSFFASLFCLIGSLALFIKDISISLSALKLEAVKYL